MSQEDRLLKSEDKLAMSDIKNRWLHSTGGEGDKTNFEHDCIDEIIHTQRVIQDAKSYAQSLKDVGEWAEREVLKIPYSPDANKECNILNELMGRLIDASKQGKLPE